MSKTEATWRELAPIWRDLAPAEIHCTDIFGELRVRLTAPDVIRIDYDGQSAEINLETGEADTENDGSPLKIPLFYMAERLALPFLRLFRGAVLLHASCIEYGGTATAFIAPPGIGKSTLAAALMAHLPTSALISDDTLAIASDMTAVPGSTHIAMRHHAFDGVGFVKKIAPLGFKHVLHCRKNRIAGSCRPVERLVRLEKGTAGIEPCRTADMTPDLLQSQFALSAAPAGFRRFQFKLMTQLISSVPLFRASFDPSHTSDFSELFAQKFG